MTDPAAPPPAPIPIASIRKRASARGRAAGAGAGTADRAPAASGPIDGDGKIAPAAGSKTRAQVVAAARRDALAVRGDRDGLGSRGGGIGHGALVPPGWSAAWAAVRYSLWSTM